MDKPNLDAVVEKIKAGISPTDEEIQLVHQEIAEIGATFETLRAHVTAAAEMVATVWQSYIASLPPEFVAEIEQLAKERGNAKRR